MNISDIVKMTICEDDDELVMRFEDDDGRTFQRIVDADATGEFDDDNDSSFVFFMKKKEGGENND